MTQIFSVDITIHLGNSCPVHLTIMEEGAYLRCWTWNCPFTGRESYLEWDKRNSLEFGYENTENCLTVYAGTWRFLWSKPETVKPKNEYEVSTLETARSSKVRANESYCKVCSLVERNRAVQGDRLRDASAEYGGVVKSRKA